MQSNEGKVMQLFQQPKTQENLQPELGERGKAILGELRKSNKTLGEMRDLLGWTYPELDKELRTLLKFRFVEYYFSPYMIWRLAAR